MAKNRAGQGTVYRLNSGKWRAQGPLISGRRVSLGTYDTEESARQAVRLGSQSLVQEHIVAPSKIPTFRAYATAWLDKPDQTLSPSNDIYRRRFRSVKKADWSSLRIDMITRRDLKEWVEMRLAARAHKRRYIKALLGFVRMVFAAAVEEERIPINPASDVRVRRDKTEDPPIRWLTMDEQKKLFGCANIAREDRLFIVFALWTGLRKWEVMALRLDHILWETRQVYIEFGSRTGPTKSKAPRTVPLLAPAWDALLAWLDVLPSYCADNPHGLLFPGPNGGFRTTWFDEHWEAIREAAGLEMVFHSLRHTAATCLVNGYWGEHMRIEDVKGFMGHSSVKQTEVYAHFDQQALLNAAAVCNRGLHTDRLFPELFGQSGGSPCSHSNSGHPTKSSHLLPASCASQEGRVQPEAPVGPSVDVRQHVSTRQQPEAFHRAVQALAAMRVT